MSETNKEKEILQETEIPFETNEEDPIQKLQEQIAELQNQTEKYLRVIADYENKIKRIQIDAINSTTATFSKLIEELTPILDDLTNAYEITSEDTKEGLALIIKNTKKTLNKYGVEEIIPKTGDTFDPEKHQAVSTKQSELAEGLIVEVLQTGYQFRHKTLKPAIVITSSN